jgi:hypothetical protein
MVSLHKSERCLSHPGSSRMATGAEVPVPDPGFLDQSLQIDCEFFAGFGHSFLLALTACAAFKSRDTKLCAADAISVSANKESVQPSLLISCPILSRF